MVNITPVIQRFKYSVNKIMHIIALFLNSVFFIGIEKTPIDP